MGNTMNAYRIWWGTLMENDHFKDQGGGRMTFRWILGEQVFEDDR
jgi:hypothetical protein